MGFFTFGKGKTKLRAWTTKRDGVKVAFGKPSRGGGKARKVKASRTKCGKSPWSLF